MATVTTTEHETVELRLRYGGGYVTRKVSTAPARECEPSEIPVLDLANIDGTLEERMKIAEAVRHAAGELGFFYIKNHGIDKTVMQTTHDQALRFFNQEPELKEKASKLKSKRPNNGWSAPKSTSINPGDGLDFKEGFGWSYSPRYDPLHASETLSPEVLAERDLDEAHVWQATSHLENFEKDSRAYWSACLDLSRKLCKIFALSLSLPEDYFDSITTFPAADCVYNYYPTIPEGQVNPSKKAEVGLGSHTDFQVFTLLWQDASGGLQVLNNNSQWIWATPIEGTFVVNIGDFLSRLSNDRYKSTVHRAYNRGLTNKPRISIPFFFGFNSEATCSVVPSCIDDEHPAKYEPISVTEFRNLTFGRSQLAGGTKIIV